MAVGFCGELVLIIKGGIYDKSRINFQGSK